VLLTLNEGLEFKLSDFEAEDVTLKGDHFWKKVEIGIQGVPTVVEVSFMC